jgi:small-conductance mechanosensitive channel/CRP-like cAMP-binding protein
VLIVFRRFLLFATVLAAWLWFGTYAPASGTVAISVVGHVLTAILALTLILFVEICLSHFFWNGYLARAIGGQVPRLLPLTVSFVLYVGTFVTLLQHDYNVPLAGALAASGFLAIILGFALRSVILDLFTGLAVSIDRSYAVGDWITVSSRDLPEPVYGRVEDIDWRTTRLRLEDGTLFIMPNSLGGIFSLNNHSQPPGPKRLEFTLLLPHETPSGRALQLLNGALRKAMEAEGLAADPAPIVLLQGIERDGVRYLIRFFADIHVISPSAATSHVVTHLHEALLQNGIAFPGEKVEIQSRQKALGTSGRGAIEPLAAIQRTRLFCDVLTTEEVRKLAHDATHRSFGAGETLIAEGDEGDSLFILLSGAANVVVDADGPAPQRLATLATGDVVGEMSLLTGKPRSASVIADTNLEAIEIEKRHLAPLLRDRPGIAAKLSRILTAREMKDAISSRPANDAGTPQGEAHAAQRMLANIRQFFAL